MQNSAEISKFRSKGQIQRLGSKFRDQRKTVGPNYNAAIHRNSSATAKMVNKQINQSAAADFVGCKVSYVCAGWTLFPTGTPRCSRLLLFLLDVGCC